MKCKVWHYMCRCGKRWSINAFPEEDSFNQRDYTYVCDGDDPPGCMQSFTVKEVEAYMRGMNRGRVLMLVDFRNLLVKSIWKEANQCADAPLGMARSKPKN